MADLFRSLGATFIKVGQIMEAGEISVTPDDSLTNPPGDTLGGAFEGEVIAARSGAARFEEAT